MEAVSQKAISRLKSGLDTWSIGARNARLINKGASPTGKSRFNTPHSAGKRKRTLVHFHLPSMDHTYFMVEGNCDN